MAAGAQGAALRSERGGGGRTPTAGKLIGWIVAPQNVSTGLPYVGHATVVWDRPHIAFLDYFEVLHGVPATVLLDMVRSATHADGQ